MKNIKFIDKKYFTSNYKKFYFWKKQLKKFQIYNNQQI